MPNNIYGSHGASKPLAYRGLRQKTLDHVVEAYDLTHAMNYVSKSANVETRDLLVVEKREFTAEVQKSLGLRRRKVL